MKQTKRKRPRVRMITTVPPGIDLAAAAPRVRYVGSSEHKDTPSPAGRARPRADATICDRSFLSRWEEVEEWLRTAIRRAWVGAPWEGDFPRYAWYRDTDDTVFEARLVNRGLGEYKGYALTAEECPEGLPETHE